MIDIILTGLIICIAILIMMRVEQDLHLSSKIIKFLGKFRNSWFPISYYSSGTLQRIDYICLRTLKTKYEYPDGILSEQIFNALQERAYEANKKLIESDDIIKYVLIGHGFEHKDFKKSKDSEKSEDVNFDIETKYKRG